MTERHIAAPSILAADFAQLGAQCDFALEAGADWLHLDVMDGHFVDNISFGPAIIKAIRQHCPNAYLDAHLMISRPDHYLERFLEAGVNNISIHLESDYQDKTLSETLQAIRNAGCHAGLTLNPATPIEDALPYLEQIDLLLIMTVVPGFGGQSFMHEVLPKLDTAAQYRDEHQLNFHLQVDGGINSDTAKIAKAHHVNNLVAGTAFYKNANPAAFIQELQTP